MTLGGGLDREWLVPLDAEGNTDLTSDGIYETTVGCHKGKWRGFNVTNPQPDCEYIWMLDPAAGGQYYAERALEITMNGGQIVKTDDPDMAVLGKLVGDTGVTFNSGYVSNGEVCLVRFPSEKIRERRMEEMETNKKMLRGGAERDFVNRASPEEELAGQGRPTRFQSFRHATEFREGGQVKELHSPDSGIVRRDKHDPFTK